MDATLNFAIGAVILAGVIALVVAVMVW